MNSQQFSTAFGNDPLVNSQNELVGGHTFQKTRGCQIEFVPCGISGSANTQVAAISEMALPTDITSVTLSGFTEAYSGEVNSSNWLYMGGGGRVSHNAGKTVISMPLVMFDASFATGPFLATQTAIT